MTRIPRGLPERPAGQGAALLALHRLAAAADAAKRLHLPEDAEALHDFRVGLRRLRVCLRSYRETLGGSVPRKALKAVRRLARDTNEARDTEVLEGLLGGWRKSLKPGHLPGLDALLGRISRPAASDGKALILSFRKDFHAVEALLKPGLSGTETGPAAGPSPRTKQGAPVGRSFGALSASLLKEACRVLRGDLVLIKAAVDDEPVHSARIAGKRLRYLLEPFQSRSFPCRKAIGRLKKLQDDLGTIHDLNLAIAAFRRCAKKEARSWSRALVEAASGRAGKPGRPSDKPAGDPIPGLVRLAFLAGRDRGRAFSRFLERWDGPRTDEFCRDVESAARALAPGRAPKPIKRSGPSEKHEPQAQPAQPAPGPTVPEGQPAN